MLHGVQIQVLFLWLTLQRGILPEHHTVTLTWADTANPPGTTYNLYRAGGLCDSAPIFANIAARLSAETYTDRVVTGPYCYGVTAESDGTESALSLTLPVLVP